MGKKPSIRCELICPGCQTTAVIWRGQARSRGHRKPLYCFKCKRRTLHIDKSVTSHEREVTR